MRQLSGSPARSTLLATTECGGLFAATPTHRCESTYARRTSGDIACGLPVIESAGAVNQLHTPPGADPPPASAELQQLLAYRFEPLPPDVPRARGFLSPPWMAGTTLKRVVVWCEQ